MFGEAPSREPLTALVFTEETEDVTWEKLHNSGITRAYVVPFGDLAGLSWKAKVEWLVDEAVLGGHKILYIDNISLATGVTTEQENGIELGSRVALLSNAAKEARLAILINHHHKKGALAPGEDEANKSRGGTALAAIVDIDIEMRRIGRRPSRVRHLSSQGRRTACNWEKRFVLEDDERTFSVVEFDEETEDEAATDESVLHDHEVLRGLVATDAKQFMNAVKGTIYAAHDPKAVTRRLDKVLNIGGATKVSHKGRPSVWTFKELDVDNQDISSI